MLQEVALQAGGPELVRVVTHLWEKNYADSTKNQYSKAYQEYRDLFKNLEPRFRPLRKQLSNLDATLAVALAHQFPNKWKGAASKISGMKSGLRDDNFEVALLKPMQKDASLVLYNRIARDYRNQ